MIPFIDRRSVYFHNDKGTLYEMQKVTGVGRKASWLFNDKMYKGKSSSFDFIMGHSLTMCAQTVLFDLLLL